MSSLKEDTSGPDASKLGRSSHLRILTVNVNTVRHPKEGSNGTEEFFAVSWRLRWDVGEDRGRIEITGSLNGMASGEKPCA